VPPYTSQQDERSICRWLSAAIPPETNSQAPDAKGITACSRGLSVAIPPETNSQDPDAEGITACSRWLSAAIPPVVAVPGIKSQMNRTPVGVPAKGLHAIHSHASPLSHHFHNQAPTAIDYRLLENSDARIPRRYREGVRRHLARGWRHGRSCPPLGGIETNSLPFRLPARIEKIIVGLGHRENRGCKVFLAERLRSIHS